MNKKQKIFLAFILGACLFFFFPVFPTLLSNSTTTETYLHFFKGIDYIEVEPLTSILISAWGGCLISCITLLFLGGFD